MPIVGPDRYTLFDQFYEVVESEGRSCYYAIVIELAAGIRDPREALQAGLRSAREHFARVGARPRGKRWVKSAEESLSIDTECGTSAQKEEATRALMALDGGPYIQQLLFFDVERGRYELISKWHHAVGDGAAHFLMLTHQLRVAFGIPFAAEPEPPLVMKTHPHPVSRSKYAGPFDLLETRAGGLSSNQRRWIAVDVDAAALRRFAEEAGGFTYTNLLLDFAMQSACTLIAQETPRVCAFLTCNNREQWSRGLGNASARVRIYGTRASQGVIERCRDIHQQVRWTMDHGEWFVRVPRIVELLPVWLRRRLLQAALRRSWSPGTFLFAHIERLADPDWGELFPMLDSVHIVPLLTRQFPLICVAITLRDTTRCTFTYDPALITDDDARAFAAEFAEQAARVEHEDRRCASA